MGLNGKIKWKQRREKKNHLKSYIDTKYLFSSNDFTI